MEIVGVALIMMVVLFGWVLCAAIPPDPEEDKEQERYVAEWERKHGK